MKPAFVRICIYLTILSLYACKTAEEPETSGTIIDLGWEEFTLIPIDTFLLVQNHGLESIRAILNNHEFQLAADSLEVAQSVNSYWMPREGDVTLNMAAYILPQNNHIRLNKRGPAGSEALIIIGDLLLPGDSVEYVLGAP